jgi:arabinofuranosyltransferase
VTGSGSGRIWSKRPMQLGLLGVLAIVAMALAWSRAWICDDAFISLRYAQSLVEGRGLVFNAGEHVEGYSNFTWVMLCAAAQALGCDPITFVQVLGVLCLGALVFVTAWAGERLLPGKTGFLPLAAVGVALHHHLQDFATCGLETLGFVLLVTATVGVLARAERSRDYALASLLVVLAALTRPDGAIFGMLAGASAVFASLRQRRLGPAMAFALPGLVLFVPFLLWRHAYYGDWLPNTFYAKSAGDPYAGQGWFYVTLFFNGYWVLWPAVAALPAWLMTWRRGGAMPMLAAMVLAYLGFVVWVGGDFMFARFCLPVVPLLYLVLEALTRCYVQGSLRWVVLVIVAVATLSWHQRADLLVMGQTVRGISDERAQYPPERVAKIRSVGKRLHELLGPTPVRVAFSGTQAMLVYDGKFDYALEAVTGLTDRWLAHQDVGPRGHVGHEKGIFRSPEATNYALTEQKVHLLLFDWPAMTSLCPFLRLEIDDNEFTMVRWDRAVMGKLLGKPGVVATDLEAYLDAYLREIDHKSKAQVQVDFVALDRVYFRWNDDPARKAKLTEWLARR